MRIILLITTFVSFSLVGMEHKKITINNHTASLIEHINRCKMLMNIEPISAALIFRFTEQKELIERGNVLSIAARDLDDIKEENYVYISGFRFIKTHLSGSQKMWVDAIIVGTTDQSLIQTISPRAIDKILITRRETKKTNNGQ